MELKRVGNCITKKKDDWFEYFITGTFDTFIYGKATF